MASGLYVIPAGADAWASYVDQPITALNDGWILDQSGTDATGAFTARPQTATTFTFTVTGDQTTVYVPGRRLRIVDAINGTIYCEVLSSVFGALTTVTITNITSGNVAGLSGVITSLGFAPMYQGVAGNQAQYFRVLNRTTTTVVASTASVTADSTLYTFTVPAGVMGSSGILRLSMFGDFLNTGGPISSVFKLVVGTSTVFAGSTTTASIAASANRRYWTATVQIQNVASASAQRASGFHVLGDANATPYTMVASAAPMLTATAYGTAAEASTAAMIVSYLVRMASTATTVDCQLRHATLELAQ